MSKMVEKYVYKEIQVQDHYKIVHYGTGKFYDHKVHVGKYARKQRFLNPEYVAIQHATKHGIEFKTDTGKYRDLLANQVLHQDWSHMSEQFPNIIGLTDLEIENFINTYDYANFNNTHTLQMDKAKMAEYIKSIKCYNDNDLTRISQNMYDEWVKRMDQWQIVNQLKIDESNQFRESKTIFVTSPRGGNEILTIFSYANHGEIRKRNLPFDWSKEKQDTLHGYKNVLNTSSLPYSYDTIRDVNDIVFVDDIFMSGEQFNSTLTTFKMTLDKLKISLNQLPRIHYMAIAGNMPRLEDEPEKIYSATSYKKPAQISDLNWFTHTIGDKRKFDKHYTDPYPFASAVVFPYSIPDGDHHRFARNLYDKYNKFPHRKFT